MTLSPSMKTPTFDLDSAKGIKALVAFLSARATSFDQTQGTLQFGPLKITDSITSLSSAADLIKRNAARAAKAGKCAAVPRLPDNYYGEQKTPHVTNESRNYFGNEKAAVEGLRRQLVQAPDMEPEAVKRAERALACLERGHDLTRHVGRQSGLVWFEADSDYSRRQFGVRGFDKARLDELRTQGFIINPIEGETTTA